MLSYDIKQGPILIGFRGNGSGHAIVGQKLLKNNRYLDEYRIEIYDNNYPGVYKNIEVEEYQDVDGKIQLLMDSKKL
ncbi:hypothetical protein CHL78_008570 [Romboutsia weinsteinii]|uniref:Uncharacterized protein n=1 Tax=Romboutsia weinsteinii TaxID=2020949 RepID=A0A371J4X9_9FIRM|nr:hypothetical protein [Romboutsia weinsteinii]RDY27763.1 hypothetical protein CHL78_008570 [Romboutsia weinsteinii]